VGERGGGEDYFALEGKDRQLATIAAELPQGGVKVHGGGVPPHQEGQAGAVLPQILHHGGDVAAVRLHVVVPGTCQVQKGLAYCSHFWFSCRICRR